MDALEREKVLNIAHRGASRVAPANTLAAFERALALGADGVELDVRLSADDVPVVIHDATVDATTDGRGPVARLTLTELKSLDAGSWFDPAFAGEGLPTLAEVLDDLGGRCLLNVELKSTSLLDRGLERAVAALLGLFDIPPAHLLISSFNPLSLRRFKRLAPAIPVGLLHAPGLPLPLRRAWLAGLAPHEARHPEHTLVDAAYVARARQRGYRVHPWTVDDPDEMRRLIALEADGIITNVPDVFRDLLAGEARA
jgi:glycerophosphoryl diester phosphodiesterase